MIHQVWWLSWHIVVFGTPAALLCGAAAYVFAQAWELDAENRKREAERARVDAAWSTRREREETLYELRAKEARERGDREANT